MILKKVNGCKLISPNVPQCCSRRHVLKSLWAGAVGGGLTHRTEPLFAADDVEWLAEVRRPLGTIPRENTGSLDPLLVDTDGRPIRTLAAWKTHRQEIRQRWMTFLGPMPGKRAAVKFEILKQDRPQGCLRQLVRYESEPGLKVEGYLLRPNQSVKNVKRAGLMALH